MNYFVTAIDTNVGKTVVSALLCRALNYSYWKPIQCGDLDYSDTMKVQKWVPGLTTYKESYSLEHPLSPHEASRLSGVNVKMDDFVLPSSDPLIVEGAGGLMVPLNEKGDLVIDIAKKIDAKIIVVLKNYLGSINHSLLTIDYLKRNNFDIKGVIISGESTPSSERIIEKITNLDVIYRLPNLEMIDEKVITTHAELIRVSLAI